MLVGQLYTGRSATAPSASQCKWRLVLNDNSQGSVPGIAGKRYTSFFTLNLSDQMIENLELLVFVILLVTLETLGGALFSG